MLFLASTTHLILLFVALELASLPVYAMMGLHRGSLRAGEAALKYLVTGAFASGALLYGSALLYGATGSLDLRAIGSAFDPESPLALIGAGLVLMGLAARVAALQKYDQSGDEAKQTRHEADRRPVPMIDVHGRG